MVRKTEAKNALQIVIDALKPLDSAERRRTVDAAMIFLGEGGSSHREKPAGADTPDLENNEYSPPVRRWMQQNSVTSDQLERVFHIGEDGNFDIHDAPGSSKKEKTINVYILTGVGVFLASSGTGFTDALARSLCESIGCYDSTNHSKYLSSHKGPEYTGSKSKGYTITKMGLKRGAELVKSFSGDEK
ncbi:hypothetical protein [Rhodoplanes elegans]|uniref:hypothetical protein n=1 Tax=Rhodoplanes elegans TaxID=29408 RepID=UPI0011B93739|nr:hypothetical protein [Rhodoplanes elegans]